MRLNHKPSDVSCYVRLPRPFERRPRSARSLLYSLPTVILPVPGEPRKTRFKLESVGLLLELLLSCLHHTLCIRASTDYLTDMKPSNTGPQKFVITLKWVVLITMAVA